MDLSSVFGKKVGDLKCKYREV
jgi:hypothetical protein